MRRERTAARAGEQGQRRRGASVDVGVASIVLAVAASCVLAAASVLAEGMRLRGAWWDETAAARRAQLTAESDDSLVHELAAADVPTRMELAEEMSRRTSVPSFVSAWQPFLDGPSRVDRCLAGLVIARADRVHGLDVVLAELAASRAELVKLADPGARGPFTHEELWSRTQDARTLRYIAVLVLGWIGRERLAIACGLTSVEPRG